jgi:hypothetical protein
MLPSLYGGSQSGKQAVDKDTSNPKADQEPAGRKEGAGKRTAQSRQPRSPSLSSGRPLIHSPDSPPEHRDADVEAHNRDMEKRSDRTVSQLHEEDIKVDKNF